MPRDKYDVETEIMELTGSYSRGVCLVCKKTVAKGSQKVVNSYDICWGCYVADADPIKNPLMYLINEYERYLN